MDVQKEMPKGSQMLHSVESVLESTSETDLISIVVVDENQENLSPEWASVTICLKASLLLSGVSWTTISKCEEDGSETTTTTLLAVDQDLKTVGIS